MGLNSKKCEKVAVEEENSSLRDNDLLQLAEAISESVLERDLGDTDSFELYAHQLRSHLHLNPEAFKHRFAEGYRVLLNELQNKSIS